MRYLVTGGTGFIGSNLALFLADQGHTVFITARPNEQKVEHKNITAFYGAIDWEKVGTLDAVFHQGAITDTTVMDKAQMFASNVDWSKEIFTQAINQGCRHIVYASSTAAYGDAPAPYVEGKTALRPLNPYAESKKALEELAERLSKQHPQVVFVGLRYCNVYGPREQHKGKMACITSQLAWQMQTGNPKIFKYGEQKRDYIYVKDVITANVLAAKAAKSTIVNCGSGKATTFLEVIDILNEVLGTKRTPEFIDNPHAGKYQSHTECDMTKAKKDLGFMPKYSLKEGYKDYLASGFLTSVTLK